ncbi:MULTISPECIES: hypothetical protein [Staphylococcus]|uniref:Uncharacterized protein n=1 Tax=Staphylococcus coagulans TaxID=74706 RepID=A0ABU1F0C4_9STAP|nr:MULTISPECIES: hypothetical protein [Staphylococcus]MDR5603841.1 hypothetical protein [Staphylococcus coagulans]MDR9833663.1 hypothetical protein [Staphylococcus coagulans]MDU9268703.1 hypothetical protein [Staphylococcus coagulans]MDU9280498.1 hypothetical protein [Staphylococcus coagulans]MDU9292541.1 hypothetical protein [Staphylococcus coagulans]
MKQCYKLSAYIFGGIAVAVLAGVAYLSYQQYQQDEEIMDDNFKA